MSAQPLDLSQPRGTLLFFDLRARRTVTVATHASAAEG
jgi:hypothetical protein